MLLYFCTTVRCGASPEKMRLRVAVPLQLIMPGDFEACFERGTVSIEGKLMLQSVRNLANTSNLLLGRPPPEQNSIA